MYTGPLSWIDLSGRMSPKVAPANSADGGDSDAVFALLYTEVLGLTDQPGAEIGSARLLRNSIDGLEDDSASPAASGGARDIRSPAPFHPSVRLADNSPTASPSDANPADKSTQGLHKDQLASWMDAHALVQSTHHCAMFCRQGMEAAGLSTADRPRSGDAADYGPFLLRHGAHVVPPQAYTPQVGDTVVFDRTSQHPSGHIEMYDGNHWVSDFMQHSFSPYRDAANTPSFTINRIT